MSFKIRKTIDSAINLLERLSREACKRKYQASRRIPWSCGYADYKYDFIGKLIDSSELDYFRTKRLPKQYGYRIDERVVEYPWFFSQLKDSERTLLDAGSVLNYRQILSSMKLQGRNLYISTLYYEGRPEISPSPSYIYEDLRTMCYRDDYFDAICSLSTIEHVGLDNTLLYTPDQAKKESDRFSYLKVIEEFSRVLKPGGSLYLSVPYGQYKNHGWFQVFDKMMVDRLIQAFNPTNNYRTFFRYENNQWNFSDEVNCADGDFFDIHKEQKYTSDFLAGARCVICLELTK